jgi:hypothetical protein
LLVLVEVEVEEQQMEKVVEQQTEEEVHQLFAMVLVQVLHQQTMMLLVGVEEQLVQELHDWHLSMRAELTLLSVEQEMLVGKETHFPNHKMVPDMIFDQSNFPLAVLHSVGCNHLRKEDQGESVHC